MLSGGYKAKLHLPYLNQEVDTKNCINCFITLYPYVHLCGKVQERFPAMKTKVNEDNELEMYITREEYMFAMNELPKLHNYSKSMPDAYEDINAPFLTSSPTEANIIECYVVLFGLIFEGKSCVKDVPDDFEGSDYERNKEFIIGNKFS